MTRHDGTVVKSVDEKKRIERKLYAAKMSVNLFLVIYTRTLISDKTHSFDSQSNNILLYGIDLGSIFFFYLPDYYTRKE